MTATTRRPLMPSAGRGLSADRKSTRLNSSHITISYAVFCLKKKNKQNNCRWCQVETHVERQTAIGISATNEPAMLEGECSRRSAYQVQDGAITRDAAPETSR